MSKPILVLGTGELGFAVLHALAAHPSLNSTPITVLRRSGFSLPSPLDSSNIKTLVADLSTISLPDLTALFKPFHTLISCNGMTLPPSIQPKIFHAAHQAGITLYFPWQFGVDYDVIGPDSAQDLFTTQLEVRALLRAQHEMEWVIVSTGMFTSFLFEPEFGLVSRDRKRVVGIGSWENEITVTSPRDIGRVVAEICLGEGGEEYRGVVYTAGDTVSMEKLAAVVEKKMGWAVEKEMKSVEKLKEEIKDDPDNGMKKYRVIFGEGVGVAWPLEKTFNHQKGMKLQSVDEWAENNLAVVEET